MTSFIDNSTFENAVLKNPGIAIVIFKTDWCTYCQKFIPVINEVSKQYKDKVTFYMVDKNASESLSNQYKIRGIPTTLIFKNGEEIARSSGAMGKPEFVSFIDNHL